MTGHTPAGSNSLQFRLTLLERELERLKELKLDVLSERVGVLSLRITELRAEFVEDYGDLRKEIRERDDARAAQIRGFQRIFVTVFTGVGIAVAVAVIAQLLSGGTP